MALELLKLKNLIKNLCEQVNVIEGLQLPKGVQKGSQTAALMQALIAFDVLKYQNRGDTFTLTEQGVTRIIANKLVSSNHVSEKYHVMQRAVSYALASFLLIDNSQLKSEQANQAKNAIFTLTQEFLADAESKSVGHLQAAAWQELQQGFNGYLLSSAQIFKQAGIKSNIKDLLRVEQFVAWELSRPVYQTKSTLQLTKDQAYTVIQTTAPIEGLTAQQEEAYASVNKAPPDMVANRNKATVEKSIIAKKAKFSPQSFKSATERSTPGLSNFLRHEFAIKNGEKPLQALTTFSFSMPAPRGSSVKDPAKSQAMTEHNIQQFLQKAAGLASDNATVDAGQLKAFKGFWGLEKDLPEGRQLIMPIAIRSYLSPVAALFNLFDKDNSNALVQQEAAIIAGINNNIDKVLEKANFRPRIYFSNYPINGQRVLMPAEQQQAAEQAAMALISDTLNNLQIIALARLKDGDGPLIQIANLISKMARCGSFDAINADIIKHLQELPVKGLFAEDSPQAKQLKLLHTVLCDYVTLHRDTAMGNGNNRGLFLSSLQSILINSMGGIDAGHCISGKDRTALVNIHTKAMLSHYEKYGRLPKYRDSDKQRKDFVAEFAALYKSLHDQEQAGFNNRGSAGIKDEPGIKTTMPKDMAKALNKTMVISKRAANLNKPNPKPGQWKKLIPIVLISLLAIAACVACPYLIPIMGISLALVTLGVTLGMLAGVLTFKQTEGKQLSVRIALSLAVAALVASVFAAPFIGSLLAPTAPLLAAATTALSTALTGLYTIAIIPVIAAVGIVTAKLKDWWWQRGLTKHSVEVMQQSNKDEPILVSAVDKRSSSDSQVIAKLALIPSKVSEVDNPSPPSSNENLASGIALKKLPVNDAAMPEKDGSRSHDGRVQSLAEQLARFDQDVLHHPSVTPSSMVADEEGTASSSSLSKPGKLK